MQAFETVSRQYSSSLIYPYLQQLKVPLLLSVAAMQMSVGALLSSYCAEVCVEMFYLCCISVTVGYHVSPHPLQYDPDSRAQM